MSASEGLAPETFPVWTRPPSRARMSAVASGVSGQVIGVASTRLASLRSGAAYATTDAGFAAGNGPMSKNMWLRPFGSIADQDTAGTVAGFEADTYGVIGGVDFPVSSRGRLGFSLSYATTDVTGDGVGRSTTDIDSYQANIYGDFTGPKGYVEYLVGMATNENSTARSIDFASTTASGSYDSDQYVFSIGAGMPRSISANTFITPTAGFSWTHVTADTYTETGAGSLNLTVNPEDVDVQLASVGLRLHNASGAVTTSIRGGIQYDIAGDEAVASATFTGGGAAFTTTGAEVEQLAGTAGVGVSMDTAGATIGANYDTIFKDGYISHTATLETKWAF